MIGRRTRLLSRTFFDRMFENDLFASPTTASHAVMWLLAALATPGVMMSGSQYYFYAHARTFTPEIQDRILFVSQAFHVDFAMAIAGVVTMLVWTSLTPDRRDALVLGPLPVRPGEQARGRLLALVRFFAMFATAVAVPTAFAFTFVTVGESGAAEVPARIAGHASATMLGAAFVFFALVDVQLSLAAAFGPRAVAVATWPLQALALVGMVGALSMTGRLADALLASDAATASWVLANPAAWFVGVYRWMAGDARDVFALLAARAALATLTAVVVALVAYPLAYQRCMQKAIAGEGRRARWWSGVASRLWLRSLSPMLRTPLERGLAAFIVAMLTRSHAHRFLIGSYAGIGALCALPLVSHLLQSADLTGVKYAWFAIPLGLLCWTSAGIRVALMLPIEPASNWIFKLTEPVNKARVLTTTVTVIQAATAMPLAVMFGLASLAAGGPVLGIMVCAVVLTTGMALIELLTLTLRTVPGTCTYRPGQLRLRVLWPLYLVTWVAIAYVLPSVAVSALDQIAHAATLVGSLLAVSAGLRVWRLARVRRLRMFVYEETEPGLTTTIDLSSLRV